VINNAGVGYRSFVELAEDDKIDQIVNVNLLGVVKCAGLFPVFRSQNKGHFINIVNCWFGQFTFELLSCYEACVWKVFQNVWPMNY
jgi:NADP-dependent 3-hydroxy acid dehydrogenase YdfG